MPNRKPELISIRSALIIGRIHMIDASARARRAGETGLAERLHNIAIALAAELDRLAAQIGL